jgi:undecaprenyl-diphosphatase
VSTIEAIILGIVQGITEFLPVSSSGHLKLFQVLLNLENLNSYIIFDLVCHLGTLFAIFIMFKKEIIQSFTSNKMRFVQVALGTLPLFPLLLIMKPIKAIFNDPQYLGYCFMLTSLILYAGIKLQNSKALVLLEKHRFRDPILIGIFQSAAILPGISRSGSTITAAKILGWSTDDAISFSFLLAIPAILGGTLIELLQLFLQNDASSLPNVSFTNYFLALITSFLFGYFALSLLKMLASKQKFMYFVWYCLILGILTTLYI